MEPDEAIDLLCFGRVCVDLYAEQIGASLTDAESFVKYVGGSAANICVGAARLGLRTAMLTRVGDEAFGRFIIETLDREGVDTCLVQKDPLRPTGIVTLALRQREGFPRIFFYRDPPDLATEPGDVDFARVRQARAVLLTGSMLVNDRLAELSLTLAREVAAGGGRVIFDADFRPVLWGLASLDHGNDLSTSSPSVTAAYEPVLPLCDLVVGTIEEVRAMGGSDDLQESLTAIRKRSDAVIVVKAGEEGATVYPKAIAPEEAVRTPPYVVEVLNSVGAGDAFMSAFVSCWLANEPLERCLDAANASGALVVTRHSCMDAMPVRAELTRFISDGGMQRPQDDAVIERLHRVATRPATPQRLFVLAIDHRWQLEELCDELAAPRERIVPLKRLLADAFFSVAGSRADCGLLVDNDYGASILEQLAGGPYWTARAIDVPRSRPVEIEGDGELQRVLHSWPRDQVVKVISYAHPKDDRDLTRLQVDRLRRLGVACRAVGRELLIELQPPEGEHYVGDDLPQLMSELYRSGAQPEWWKLPSLDDPSVWRSIGAVIDAEDPSCRGVLVLGSTADLADLVETFTVLAAEPCVRGFAIGRAVFRNPARAWLLGKSSDEEVVLEVASAYRELIEAWSNVDGNPLAAQGAAR